MRRRIATIFIIILTMTAGTGLIMWLGELITQRGIGNGMSILIFASIISRLPGDASIIKAQSGTFVAEKDSLVTKCPSKYAPKDS